MHCLRDVDMDDYDIGTDTESITHSDILESLHNNLVDGSVDYKGRPVFRFESGCWRSAYFIIGKRVSLSLSMTSVDSAYKFLIFLMLYICNIQVLKWSRNLHTLESFQT